MRPKQDGQGAGAVDRYAAQAALEARPSSWWFRPILLKNSISADDEKIVALIGRREARFELAGTRKS
jgi:hypothetical protein